jgi:hypothetical protein
VCYRDIRATEKNRKHLYINVSLRSRSSFLFLFVNSDEIYLLVLKLDISLVRCAHSTLTLNFNINLFTHSQWLIYERDKVRDRYWYTSVSKRVTCVTWYVTELIQYVFGSNGPSNEEQMTDIRVWQSSWHSAWHGTWQSCLRTLQCSPLVSMWFSFRCTQFCSYQAW